MPLPTLSALRGEYEDLFASAQIARDRATGVALVVHKIMRGRERYEAVAAATGVPWAVIGVIHAREADCDFRCHLHNGDPLTARTHHVPAGRPANGEPPFTWEESAADALAYDKITSLGPDWGVAAALYAAERINGFGYRQKIGIRSPYLWAGTTHQQRGKYVADGRYDYQHMDTQPGVAALLLAILADVPDALGAPGKLDALDVTAVEDAPPAADAPVPVWREPEIHVAATASHLPVPPQNAPERPLISSKSLRALVSSLLLMIGQYFDRVTGWIGHLLSSLPDIYTDVETQLSTIKSLAGLLGAVGKTVFTPETLTALSVSLTLYAVYRLAIPRGA